MVSFKSLLPIYFVASAFAAPGPAKPGPNPNNACGKVNVIFTGLPPYHPLVTSQGFDPAMVDKALRGDAAHILAAGYNLRVVLMGPEQDISILEDNMKAIKWDGTGVGYGVRGSRVQSLTVRLEDIIDLYKERAPRSETLFDYSPDSALWAIQRRFPLPSNCTNSPGKDLGFNLYCDICG